MSERVAQRALEMIPGVLIWITFIASISLSFFRPLWVVYFVIVFDLFWLFRVCYFVPFLITSWRRYREAIRVDWQAKASALSGYDRVCHLVFLPMVDEDISVVRATLDSFLAGSYPADRIMIVLAGEERKRAHFEPLAEEIRQKYADRFMDFLVTLHPKDIEGEIIGKGSNLNWAGHHALSMVDTHGVSYDDVIVSSFDIDTIPHREYFSCLTATYLQTPDPTRSSYQPVAVYNNNLWESPAIVRVVMFGTTFWLLTELARPEGALTFSSHSMSLRMLVDVGFWQNDIVSEDSRIFLQALLRYHGGYRVTPVYVPVSMDTVMAGNYWKAIVALYKQMRRWAWGVENFPFLARAFWKDAQMSFWTKFFFLSKQLEGSYTWATAAVLIFLLGRLPFWVASDAFRQYAVFQNTPFTLQWLMRFAMIGVFVSAAVAFTFIPPRPATVPKWQAWIVTIFQWALLPITFTVFGALPAIDAQTRMMLGMKLGFHVSPKRVKVE